MKIKTKRIITSLALAASLALSSVNVSAANLEITQGDVVSDVANKQTTVRVNRGGVRYLVEVPEVLEFNLKNPDEVNVAVDSSDSSYQAPTYSTEELRIYLRKASGFTVTQKLEVMPTFKGNIDYHIDDGDVEIKSGDSALSSPLEFTPPHQEQQPFDYFKKVDCSIKGNDEIKKRVYESVDENDPNGAVTIGHIQYKIEVKS